LIKDIKEDTNKGKGIPYSQVEIKNISKYPYYSN
jgi:hypothetical protein